jgi:cold shock CspA family protein
MVMEADAGIITGYWPERGYGFLWHEPKKKDWNGLECFFHVKDCLMKKLPERGDLVSCRVETADRGHQAKDVRLVEAGRTRKPSLVGVTSWVGPKGSGEYGLANHRGEKENGAFVHNSCLVDGTSTLKSSCLYRMDVARSHDRYVGLNVRRVNQADVDLIQKLGGDPEEDPRVRLKALEMHSAMTGRSDEFARKVREAVQEDRHASREASRSLFDIRRISDLTPVPELTLELYDLIKLKVKGAPDDNTVKIVQNVVVGGIAIATIGLAAVALKAVCKV